MCNPLQNDEATLKTSKSPKDIRTEADELLSSLGIPGVGESTKLFFPVSLELFTFYMSEKIMYG